MSDRRPLVHRLGHHSCLRQPAHYLPAGFGC